MSCPTYTTTLPVNCTECVHPFVYLFEKVAEAKKTMTRSSFMEILDRFLDKGIVMTNCNTCCPNCGDVYSLASVETQIKLFELLGLVIVPALPGPLGATASSNQDTCCSNVYASVETYLKYAEAIGITAGGTNDRLITCCNGFDKCVDDLLCWAINGSPKGDETVDRLLDKGIAEYSGIKNNCTFQIKSELCLLVQLFIQYDILSDANSNGDSAAEVFDRVLDKGITIACSDTGEIIIASVETALKYIEAVWNVAVPALPASQTTTTTTI